MLVLWQAYEQLKESEVRGAVLTMNTWHKMAPLPFEISAAAAIFQGLIETTLDGILGINMYLHEIIVIGTS